MKTATYIEPIEEWSARTLLFKVKPKVNNHRYILVTAACATDNFYEMIIYLCAIKNNGITLKNLKAPKIPHRCNFPEFAKAIELRLGYTVDNIKRIPRDIRRFPR